MVADTTRRRGMVSPELITGPTRRIEVVRARRTIALRCLRAQQIRGVQIESFSDLNDTRCDAPTPLVPPVTGDDTARITYNLGALTNNQTKTVVFRYQRL
jgi:hypothetical protein